MPCISDLALREQTGWSPCKDTLPLTRVLTSVSGKPTYEDDFPTLFRFWHARPVHSQGTAILDLPRLCYPRANPFPRGLSPQSAWTLTPMQLPPLYSRGIGTLHPTWIASSLCRGSDSLVADHALIPMITNLIAFALKCLGREGEWERKEEQRREKVLCFVLNAVCSCCDHSQKLIKKRGCLFYLTFQTFKLIVERCWIIKRNSVLKSLYWP